MVLNGLEIPCKLRCLEKKLQNEKFPCNFCNFGAFSDHLEQHIFKFCSFTFIAFFAKNPIFIFAFRKSQKLQKNAMSTEECTLIILHK